MKHQFKILVYLLLWSALSASIRQDRLPISVYWISSPTHVNETLLIAGAGLDQASAKLCRDANCHAIINSTLDFTSWKQSLSFVLPDACATPPCYLVLEQSAAVDKEIIAVNAPDVWWGLSGEPSAIPTTGFENVRSILSNKPHDIHVTIGDNIRVFGRSLAWSSGNPRCIPTAGSEPSAVPSTRLILSPSMAMTTLSTMTIGDADKNSPGVPALSAACYEATFSSSGMMAGHYPEAVVVTPWGTSQKLNITLVSPRAKPTRHTFDVGVDFGGNLSLAVDRANAIATADPTAAVDLMLGTRTYHLQAPVVLPNRTRLVGSGAGASTLVFDLAPPAPPGPTRCSAPVLSDFYTDDCKQRGCHVKRRCPGCFLQVGVLTSPSTLGECCAACIANPACNAWTFIGDVGGGRGSLCELNSCPDEPSPGHNATCAATPSSPGPHNRTSGWVLGRTLPKAPLRAAILIGGQENSLVNFSVRVQSAPAHMPAVAMETSATSFVAKGLNITLLQVSRVDCGTTLKWYMCKISKIKRCNCLFSCFAFCRMRFRTHSSWRGWGSN